MSDIVERLRDAAAAEVNGAVYDYGDYWNLCDAAADEITRLRERVENAEAMRKQWLDAMAGLSKATDRIAHLERVVAAADAMREQYVGMRGGTDLPTVRAYDAVRKGEG